MLDTRGQDVRWPVKVGKQEAAIDQVCFPIRICRRQNVDVSKREFGTGGAQWRESSGTFVAHNPRCIRYITHQSRCPHQGRCLDRARCAASIAAIDSRGRSVTGQAE